MSTSSLPSVVGAGAVRSARVSGSVAALPTHPLDLARLPSVASSVFAHPLVPSAAVPPSFSSPFPPPTSFTPPLPSFYPAAVPVTPSVAPVVSIPSFFPSFPPPSFPVAPSVRPCLLSMPPGPRFPLGPPLASSSSSYSVSSLLSLAPPASSSFFLSVPPHVLIRSMFMAPRVPRMSSLIFYTFGMMRIRMTKATRSLMLCGGLASLLPFVRSSPLLLVSSLPPNPQTPALLIGRRGLMTLGRVVNVTLEYFSPFLTN